MTKGFQAPNYTQIPNDLFDMLPELGEALTKFLLAICRLTFGYHRDRARASLTKLQKMTGLSRPSVVKAANQALELGLVEKIKDGGVNEWVVNVVNHQELGLVKKLNQTSKEALPPSIKEKETNNNNILNKKDGAKPRTHKKKRDPLLDHPAIIAHKEIIRLHVPIIFREAVVNIVGDSPASLNKWKQTLRDWIGAGYNPRGIKNILDKFQGGKPRKKTDAEERAKYTEGEFADFIEH